MKKIISMMLCLLLLLGLTACGANSAVNMKASAPMAMNAAPVEEAAMDFSMTRTSGESTSTALPENRKWIITVYMNAETEDLDTMTAALDEQIKAMNGYVEDKVIYNGSAYSGRRYRYANLTVRVPADQVEAFTEHMSGISNIISKNKSMDDVTLQYVATESRMKALKAEEERLLELMAQAENMSDLLQIEARLTDVRYELESVTSQLRVYDNLVDYATIHLNLTEVQEYTPVEEETLWQRISGGFVESLKNLGNFFVELFVALIVGLPYLVFIGAIVVVVVILCRRSAKKRKQKSLQHPPYPYAPPQNPTENQ